MDIVKKYAAVLLEEAKRLNASDKVLRDIEIANQIIFSENEISSFLESPANIGAKYSILSKIATHCDLSDISLRWMMQVIKLKRIKLLSKMVLRYKSMMNNNRKYAEITTARELSVVDIKEVEKILSQKFGDNLDVEYKSDKSIIGGMIVRVEDLLLDVSVRNALGKLI
ncbi:MAG: ATP synthase F1 subunit delta [Rickettsiaceae bacterium]|nr:ATP synthase F1 subunit delta [Rickettsiaceae bacterium]